MRKGFLLVLVLASLPLIAATGDATRQIAMGMAGVLALVSPVAIKFIRQQWPNLDGRIFWVVTFAVACVITIIAFVVGNEWKGLDTSVSNFMTWASILWAIQQAVYNLFKPQLQVVGAK